MTCAIKSIPASTNTASATSRADLVDGSNGSVFAVVDDDDDDHDVNNENYNNDNDGIHYFAIGAMMNPISVKNRQLDLERNADAVPGYLLDHKLVFFGSLGFAEVVYQKGSIVHGIVYRRVDREDMKILDNIERDYIRKSVTIHCYPPVVREQQQQQLEAAKEDDTNDESEETMSLSSSSSSLSSTIGVGGSDDGVGDGVVGRPTTTATTILKNVSVYCRTQNEIEQSRSVDQPPSKRYLEVIIEGAKHYGVHPSYIQYLQEEKCRPRPSPCDYLSFVQVDGYDQRCMTRDRVDLEGSGRNGKPLYARCRGRVIELVREPSTAAIYKDFTESFFKHGRDIELYMSKMMYDPLFGIPKCLDDVLPAHAASCEHFFCDYFKGCNAYDKWRVIAKIVPEEDDQDNKKSC